MPAERRGKKRNKPYLNPAQFNQLLERIAEPYATMVYVAIYTGLRVSELAGLRWEDIHEESITIDERYCRGDWGAPKSECSNATIAVNRCVIERIHRMRILTVEVKAGRAVRKYRIVKSDGPSDLVFQSVKDGKPIRDNNILTRFIKPAARKLALGWVNWRSLRTSHAVWLKMAGADVKDAQGQMRHSRASTTLDIYQQFVPESQQRVVNKLSSLGTSIN
jgi:integrase